MRIALVIERMDDFRGGRETSTGQIATVLASRGHEVEILCESGSWRGKGVEVVELGRRGLTRSGRLGKFIAAVQARMSSERYDIVHGMLPLPGANVYQLRSGTIPGRNAAARRRWGALAGIRVGLLGAMNLHRRRTADLERQVAGDPKTFCLAVSEMVAAEFHSAYGDSDRLRVIVNAVDLPPVDVEQRADWRQRLRFKMDVPSEGVVFLTVATNFRLKGIAELIAAFSKWIDRSRPTVPVRLVVVGRASVEGYQRMASMRNIAPITVFVPPVQNIYEWYAAADACVLLSWYDPCSRVVLEATRWGIPSLTTALNGASEVIAACGGGVVVESPKDTAGIVAGLDALADPERREEMADACRATSDTLGMDRHVDQLLDVYREAVART